MGWQNCLAPPTLHSHPLRSLTFLGQGVAPCNTRRAAPCTPVRIVESVYPNGPAFLRVIP
jgi:hypothetical protein